MINRPWSQQKQRPKKNAGLMTCVNNHPMFISRHKGGVFVMSCQICGYESSLVKSHPYFTHPQALTRIGDKVRLPQFKNESGELTTAPAKAEPDIIIGELRFYYCRQCRASISKGQAEGTFKDFGKALCPLCYGGALLS